MLAALSKWSSEEDEIFRDSIYSKQVSLIDTNSVQEDRRLATEMSRILDRSGEFHQSYGTWNLKRIFPSRHKRMLYQSDLFHTLVNMATYKICIISGLLFILLTFVLALPYYVIGTIDGPDSDTCGMNVHSLMDAYFFSLELMATVGLGKSDFLFRGCISVAIFMSIQVVCNIIAEAAIIGVIFARISRPQQRSKTIIFTDRAVIRRINGRLLLMFQVCELRKHQLVEAHIRCYAIRRGSMVDGLTHVQLLKMNLIHPDQETGSALLLAFPNLIVHEIDAKSPLRPSVDIFPSNNNKKKDEKEEDHHHKEESMTHNNTIDKEQLVISQHLIDSKIEILAVLEGADSLTSSCLQARHSYIAADIDWNVMFEPCVFENADGEATVDFRKFNSVVQQANSSNMTNSIL